MAAFRSPEDWERLDWMLLQCSPVTRYLSRRALGDHLGWLQQHQYRVYSFDCSAWASEEDFHTEVSRVLGFPGYYGRNLNAFNDCLSDLDVPDAGGVALVFVAFDTLYRKSPEWSWAILDIIAGNSRRYLLTGQRLLALVQSDDSHIPLKEVGACPVMVNPTEFGR